MPFSPGDLVLLYFGFLYQAFYKLKEENSETWRKVIKRSAINKLLVWCTLGSIWLGILVATDFANMPARNVSVAIFMGLGGFSL